LPYTADSVVENTIFGNGFQIAAHSSIESSSSGSARNRPLRMVATAYEPWPSGAAEAKAAPSVARLDHDIARWCDAKVPRVSVALPALRTRRYPGKYQAWSRADVRRAHPDCQFEVGRGTMQLCVW
jgi:hypothetical protein